MEAYIKSESELLEIAEAMLALAKQSKQCVYRYRQTVYDSSFMDRGRKNVNHCGFSSTYNAEDIESRVYSWIRGEELFPFNLRQFETWRERHETPFVFSHKGEPLPAGRHVEFHQPPQGYERWDRDFEAFTREYKNERITREFGVEQCVTVNSAGGMVAESRPFFSLHYRQGYHPHMVTRSVGAYVKSEADMDRLPALIRYLPDPNPEGRIRNADTFADAFANLHEISREVHCNTLADAGFGNELTHDVVMLSGVPIHEIFGHQFEEPIYPLNVGQQSLFPVGKDVQNRNIRLRDDPGCEIGGLEVMGSYHFDSYGRPARAVTHIEDSRVKDHLGGEYVDQKNIKSFMGVERSAFIGSARQGDEGAFPQPRMSCTVLEGAEENLDTSGKIMMVPFDGYVLDGNFFKVLSSECYFRDSSGNLKRFGPLEASRTVYDALRGMHILPGKSHHIGTCGKPNVLDEEADSEVMVSFLANHQLWEQLTVRTL